MFINILLIRTVKAAECFVTKCNALNLCSWTLTFWAPEHNIMRLNLLSSNSIQPDFSCTVYRKEMSDGRTDDGKW